VKLDRRGEYLAVDIVIPQERWSIGDESIKLYMGEALRAGVQRIRDVTDRRMRGVDVGAIENAVMAICVAYEASGLR
jgi:hypothetical protein